MGLEAFLTDWGVAAVFLGAMVEGETFVIGGGALSARGILVAWQVALAAFAGSVAMDQLCFMGGRYFREHRWVKRLQDKPAFARAIDFVERHPTGYIIAFRYLYGLRIVSPVAIGLTQVPSMRFLLLNIVSAAIWALLFTTLGYAAGHAYERMFGQVHSLSLFLVGALLASLVVSVIVSRSMSARAERGRGSAPKHVVDERA